MAAKPLVIVAAAGRVVRLLVGSALHRKGPQPPGSLAPSMTAD
jgi:hypothetical protein